MTPFLVFSYDIGLKLLWRRIVQLKVELRSSEIGIVAHAGFKRIGEGRGGGYEGRSYKNGANVWHRF